MTAEKDTRSADRRKRVQFLKRLIILSLITSILIPIVLCIILFIRIQSLEKQIEELKDLVTAEQMQVSSGASVMEENGSQGYGMEPIIVDGSEERGESDAFDTTAGMEEMGDLEDAEESVRKVYLTFDDGPSSCTDEILDILAEYDVKATFFVVGKEGEWAEEAYRRIVEEGHTLGMHSYTHEYSNIYASVDAYAEDLSALQEYLYEVTGISCKYVRFPGGSSNKVSKTDMKELIAYLNEAGYVYYDWNVSSQDASGRELSVEEIVDNCMEGLEKHDNAVILMHDAAGRHTTVEALPILIEAIQAMENTELLPITDDTVPVQHITITQQEETED